MRGRMPFYAAAPIVWRDDGAVVADKAIERRNAEHAVLLAEQLSQQPRPHWRMDLLQVGAT